MAKQGADYLPTAEKLWHDRTAAVAAAGLLLAPIALVAAGTMVDTRSLNPFYTQERNGVLVRKFRSLNRSAEVGPLRTYGTYDSRATKFGQFIRKLGMDETPQLTAVLKGEMSFVGIRDILQQDKEKWHDVDPVLFDELEAAKVEAGVKPALFGESSIMRKGILNGSPQNVAKVSMEMDMRYIEKASLYEDTRIVAALPKNLLHKIMHPIYFQPYGPEDTIEESLVA